MNAAAHLQWLGDNDEHFFTPIVGFTAKKLHFRIETTLGEWEKLQ